ncbi:MAG: hypothetical protein KKB20_24570 [Proteobacteria bacterium]|nr:hypothetical protein [Pseudomonadota bacterium]
MENTNKNGEMVLLNDQRQITSCALEVIRSVKKRRGRPLQPRDRMALKLLTPRNSALLLKNGVRNLGCRQVSFEIITDDLGRGAHRLAPTGIHVFRPEEGWWSDRYGQQEFLWNLYHKEGPKEGLARILECLFKFKLSGIFGAKAKLDVLQQNKRIAADIHKSLKLYIQRDTGLVETSLRRLIKAGAIHSATDLGLPLESKDQGQVALLFGRNSRYAVSFRIERL